MWIGSKSEGYGADSEGGLMEQQAKKCTLSRLNYEDGAETLGWKGRKEELEGLLAVTRGGQSTSWLCDPS